MRIRSVVTRLLLLGVWTGAVAATTIWVTGGAGEIAAKQMYVTTEMAKTGRELDLAIAGDGYFMVEDVLVPGGYLYTRYGRFKKNCHGEFVVTVDDHARVINPPIVIPSDATEIHVSRDGLVSYVQPTEATPSIAGAIHLAQFDPDQLQPYEDQLFFLPADGAMPRIGAPGSLGFGSLRQRKLEASVLKLTEALESPTSNRKQQ